MSAREFKVFKVFEKKNQIDSMGTEHCFVIYMYMYVAICYCEFYETVKGLSTIFIHQIL